MDNKYLVVYEYTTKSYVRAKNNYATNDTNYINIIREIERIYKECAPQYGGMDIVILNIINLETL